MKFEELQRQHLELLSKLNDDPRYQTFPVTLRPRKIDYSFIEFRKRVRRRSNDNEKKRIKANPVLTKSEYDLGTFVEGLEAQVMEVVLDLYNKGYSPISSGFDMYYPDIQHIQCESGEINSELEAKLKDLGVDVLRYGKRVFSLRFLADSQNIEEIEKKWKAICSLLPKQKHKSKMNQTPLAQKFRKKYC